MESIVQNLKKLYSKTSKHSNYQILSKKLTSLIGSDQIEIKSRYEKERLNYILSHIETKDKRLLDIGGNTGFFTFELLEAGASSAVFYEGNTEHALFVKEAGRLLGYGNRLSVRNSYFNFDKELTDEIFGVVLLLNVLHHVGDDYGIKDLSIDNAKKQIIANLNFFAGKTNVLVFQLGFCWKGDRNALLFENGTKKEMIDFIKSGAEKNWLIADIAIPEIEDGRIVYKTLNEDNIQRSDKMGEFLNRPLFIMKSLNM